MTVAQTGVVVNLQRELVVVVGLVLASLLVAVAVLTVGLSVYEARQRRRRDAVREDLREEFLDRLYDPDGPNWEAWVAGLDRTERVVVEDLVDSYLRRLKGRDAEAVRALGSTLGIPARERDNVTGRDGFVRLRALTWLTLLRVPAESALDGDGDPRTPRERAAVARYRYETAPDHSRQGVETLLGDGSEPCTAFGVDTLYRFAERDPTTVIEVARERETWSVDLLTQVLVVCRNVESGLAGADLSWFVSLLDHGSPRVRAEAARTLARFGWRTRRTDRRFLERLTADGVPAARAGGYTMLGAWGGETASDVLVRALETEDHERAMLAGAQALRAAGAPEATVPEPARPAWRWVREHERFDERVTEGVR